MQSYYESSSIVNMTQHLKKFLYLSLQFCWFNSL